MDNLSKPQFKVLDFQVAKMSKAATGKVKLVQADSPSMTKHEDDAIAVANAGKPKPTRGERIAKALGLVEPE